MERVTDERISYVLGSPENRWAFVGPDEMESLLRELQSRRAAEREQAAPAEPRLAKWERQLREMGGSLRYNAESAEWEVWLCSLCGDWWTV
jgi:hypothetical protein